MSKFDNIERAPTTIGSLFSGIGGLELGLAMALPDSRVAWQVECDQAALAVLREHFPDTRRIQDVRWIDAGFVERVDILCGGFPCQPHSVAGKRRGTDDKRWLWPEFARIIEELKPAIVFIENVPGLRTSGLRDVLADLARLGFDAEWDCFSAEDVGAPHRRSRLFVLAYSRGIDGWLQSRRTSGATGADPTVAADDGADGELADATGAGLEGQEKPASARKPNESTRGRGDVANADGERQLQPGGLLANEWRWPSDRSWWNTEPDVGRVANGVPAAMDRIRILGNAVVPQQAALAFKTLMSRVAA